MDEDDTAMTEIDQWIAEKQRTGEFTNEVVQATLNARINQRLDDVEKDYEAFVLKNPEHAGARLAYGSFLSDRGKTLEAKEQWEKAAALDPTNAAAWNNLATYHGHEGQVKKAFEYYEKAIALKPREALYYHNFGTTVYLFRKDAREYWGINEQAVFDKAFKLYFKAMELDPTNFALASDVAQSYYIPKPFRYEDAVRAWKHTLTLAENEKQRQGVYIHLARCEKIAEHFDAAREYLKKITDPFYEGLKKRVATSIDSSEAENQGGSESPDG